MKNDLTDEARQARREYLRKWRKENREKVNSYHKKWRSRNPDKVKKYQTEYWERKAGKQFSIEDKVMELRQQGHSLRHIAAKVGINHMKVNRIIKNRIDEV